MPKCQKTPSIVSSKLQNISFSFLFCQKVSLYLANVIKATFSLLSFRSFHTMHYAAISGWSIIAGQYKASCLHYTSIFSMYFLFLLFLLFSLTFYVFPPSLSFTSPFSLSFLYLSPCHCFLSVFRHVCLIPTLPCN